MSTRHSDGNAGAGSYEPLDRTVTAVEPSAAMRAQRPAHLPRAIDAVAEKLPFAEDGDLKGLGFSLGGNAYSKQSRQDPSVLAQFPLHSGRIIGLPGRILICLLGLAVAGLSITGVYIWLRKHHLRWVWLRPFASGIGRSLFAMRTAVLRRN
jgi:hypothetical protein